MRKQLFTLPKIIYKIFSPDSSWSIYQNLRHIEPICKIQKRCQIHKHFFLKKSNTFFKILNILALKRPEISQNTYFVAHFWFQNELL